MTTKTQARGPPIQSKRPPHLSTWINQQILTLAELTRDWPVEWSGQKTSTGLWAGHLALYFSRTECKTVVYDQEKIHWLLLTSLWLHAYYRILIKTPVFWVCSLHMVEEDLRKSRKWSRQQWYIPLSSRLFSIYIQAIKTLDLYWFQVPHI